uniref:Uncharacterized protein n=1 Tax=Plectus sambesii TaxID=2011161 RepID=A0A914WY80_9BILA
LVVSYLLARDNTELNTLAARLLLDCLPGLDSSVVFQETEDLVAQLFRWAESGAEEPLRSYATGLLASAMEVTEIASTYRAQNATFVPIALRRLREIKQLAEEEEERRQMPGGSDRKNEEDESSGDGPFANLKRESFADDTNRPSLAEVIKERKMNGDVANCSQSSGSDSSANGVATPSRTSAIRIPPKRSLDDFAHRAPSPPKKRAKMEGEQGTTSDHGVHMSAMTSGRSNSSWLALEPLVIGTHCMYPMTPTMQQRLLLQFLTPTGEYQDLVSYAFEHRAMEQILGYIDLTKNKDVRLAFDALKYLASLLVHRRFALEFVAHSGVEYLINVYQSSMASVGVATCLYYLAYNEDVMEKLCLLSEDLIDRVVDYALWLLEHSYESGRASASMFFTHAFPFRPILERFDKRDGPRRLFNYISTLTILQEDGDDRELNDENMFSSLQAVRNVCSALRSYFVSHLYVKVEQLKRTQASRLNALPNVTVPSAVLHSIPQCKAMHLDAASMRDSVWLLLNVLPMHAVWKPVEELRRLGVIRTLLFIIGESNDWNLNQKTELVRNTLEVLWVCSVIPRVQLDLCGIIKMRNGSTVEGIGTAENRRTQTHVR